MPPETVAAVHGAAAGDNQQHPALVFVDDARARIGAILFAHRVGAEARWAGQFLPARQYLAQQRVPRVPRLHPGDKTARHLERKIGTGRLARPHLAGLQFQHAEQFGGRGDDIAQLLAPVLRGGDARQLVWHVAGLTLVTQERHSSARPAAAASGPGGRAGCRTTCRPPGRASAAACRQGSVAWAPRPSRRSAPPCR